jgi:hypothetical protein
MFNSSWLVGYIEAYKCKMIFSGNTRHDRCWGQLVDEKFLEIFVDVFWWIAASEKIEAFTRCKVASI